MAVDNKSLQLSPWVQPNGAGKRSGVPTADRLVRMPMLTLD